MNIQSSCHPHPLQLVDFEENLIDHWCNPRCIKCKKDIAQISYFHCYTCHVFYHYHCVVTLPQHINHSFHSDHRLNLLIQQNFKCCVCKMFHCSFLSYTCAKCNFNIDVECALWPTVTCKLGQQPICHLQPMALLENVASVDDQGGGGVLKCLVCRSPCPSGSSSSTFVCTVCKRFVHKSCTELPLEITHPFQPQYPLFLRLAPYHKSMACVSCLTRNFTFFFQNDKYSRICVRCSFLRPTIKYQGHDHLLTFIDKIDRHLPCYDGFGGYCLESLVPNEFSRIKSNILRCVNCDFNLHLLCGPLPCTIKHKCHLHPLTLFDSIIEDNSGEYYCDACETERDPRICVYYCEQCKYAAHIRCVISEVVRALKGDSGDVEFRCVGQRKCSVIKPEENVIKDEFMIMTKTWEATLAIKERYRERKKKLASFPSVISLSEPTTEEHGQDISKVRHRRDFSPENFTAFVHRLLARPYDLKRFAFQIDDPKKLKLVNVGGYLVPWRSAYILHDLLAKHGDIAGDSHVSIGMKSIMYSFLCGVIHSMRTTLLTHVTEGVLCSWYECLNMARSYDFEVDFIYAHLGQVARAYYGLAATRAEDSAKTQMDQKILQLQQQIEGLQAELEKCGKDREEYYRASVSEKYSDFLIDSLSKASMLKWKFVGDDLL